MACAPVTDGQFLASVIAHVDCQAQAIGAGGYQALAASSSPVSLIATGALTVFVALFGFRMMLGETPGLRESVMAAVKIGIVLVLATSWPAFRTLAYDVALRGPAELAAAIGRPAGVPGAGGGLVPQLQVMDDALAELVKLGAGKPQDADTMAGPTAPLNQAQQQQELQRLAASQQRPRWDPQKEAEVIGKARTVFLAASIASLASVRFIAGIMLALAPLFALFLLFRGTRGVFEGWLRVLGGAALGAAASALILGVEVALVGPWLMDVLAQRQAGIPVPGLPIELLAVTLVFALSLLAVLIACARVAAGFRIPDRWREASEQFVERLSVAPAAAATSREAAVAPAAQRGRAFAIADAITTTQRREATAPPAQTAWLGRAAPAPSPARPPEGSMPVAARLGQSYRRAGESRVSPARARRDRQWDRSS